MSIKNKDNKIVSKIAAIALLSGCMYFGGDIQETYADNTVNTINQSYTKSNVQKGKIKPCDFLNVRTGPSTKYSVVTKVYTNNLVEIIDKSSNGWYKIKASNGVVGWASGRYIEIQANNPAPTNPPQNVGNTQTQNKRKQVVELAHKQIGKPYKWAGNGPTSFDCSGLTSYVYKNAANVTLPRVSRDQANVGKTVSKQNLQEGDLLFFSSNGKTITHVGIYIGNSKMIHAPSSGKNVKIDSINSSYYQRTYVTAKSIL